MTRKDYELVAGALNTARRHCIERGDVEHICKTLAATLQTDNPRFDRGKFLKACGID